MRYWVLEAMEIQKHGDLDSLGPVFVLVTCITQFSDFIISCLSIYPYHHNIIMVLVQFVITADEGLRTVYITVYCATRS